MDSSKEMKKNSAIKSRKWLLTINNPYKEEYKGNYELDSIKKIIEDNFSTIKYYCHSLEIGSLESTPHIHLFLQYKSPVIFSQLKRYFPAAHIDLVKNGSPAQNRAYVFKEGKWKDTEKGATTLPETHFEWGETPEGDGQKKTTLIELYESIKAGKSDLDIMEDSPQYLFHMDKIERIRQKLAAEHYSKIFRKMTVIYLWGRTGSGKSSYVLQSNEIATLYRISDYERDPFSNYDTVKHRTVIFDEFRGQLKISDMLNYLDGFPVFLSSRYSNKIAGYDKAYIIGNEPLQNLYQNVQFERPETWKAFKRRFDLIINFNEFDAMGLKDFESKFTYIKSMEAEVIKRKNRVEPNEFDYKINVKKVDASLLAELIAGTLNQQKDEDFIHTPILYDGEDIIYYSYHEMFEFR